MLCDEGGKAYVGEAAGGVGVDQDAVTDCEWVGERGRVRGGRRCEGCGVAQAERSS